MRRDVEFLVSEGHLHAPYYPIGKVWSESRLARSRVNARVSTDAVMMHTVISSILGGKDLLSDALKALENG
jgi:hypothetical protein